MRFWVVDHWEVTNINPHSHSGWFDVKKETFLYKIPFKALSCCPQLPILQSIKVNCSL